MEERKINDIVTPTTPYKHRELGKGMVIDIGPKIEVVFPSLHATFEVHKFRSDAVKVVDAEPDHKYIIEKVAYTYQMLEGELKNA